ncbi:MAG TPA: hypothetical protein DCE41_05910 [Cytophagales bacterium]|nr:hypothetical protein [Cytophagales bacterium]HAP62791.1 hypothetical protein [Cytophagales bacterium]
MDLTDIQKTYRSRRNRQIIIGLLALLGFAAMLYINVYPQAMAPLKPLQVVLLVLVLEAGMLIASLLNWRCPNCNKHLGRGWNPKACPKCGVELR